MMEVKLKRLHERAVLPTKANTTDAGFDFTAVSEEIDPVNRVLTYRLGWAIEIPEGHVGLMFPRSSVTKKDIVLGNSVGVIDAGYRGELMAKFKNLILGGAKKYKVDERVIQLIIMPIPQVDLVVVDQLSNSERGEGAYGSSGV